MKLLLQDYDYKLSQPDSVMEEMESLCKKIFESEQILAIKDIGLITVARFLSEIGDVRRFESPRQIQKLAGLLLRENSSGKHKGETIISKRGRSKLRVALFNAAIQEAIDSLYGTIIPHWISDLSYSIVTHI